MEQLYFLTGSANKFAEAKIVIPWIEQQKVDLPEIQELDSKAIIKAKIPSGKNLVVEDTSLCIHGMNGFPGPLIKWMLKSVGAEGIARMAHVFEDTSATARTCLGYVAPDRTVHFFDGTIEGRIVKPRGVTTFGWDTIFLPDGHIQTFAEMGREAKCAISMRTQAFKQLKEFLENRKTK